MYSLGLYLFVHLYNGFLCVVWKQNECFDFLSIKL